MRKITLFLCSLLIAASALGQTWKYTTNTSSMTATITGLEEGTSYSGPLNIPATINYGGNVLKVTTIGESAFNGYKGITSVVIPEGVKSTGNNAFNGCSALQEVTIPSTVTSLGYLTFSNCTNLTTVNYNAANAGTSTSGNFDYVTFKGDTKLKNFIIGDKVQTIPYYLCYGCSGLTNLTITGDNLTNINEYAFYNCSLSEGITLPSSLVSIGNAAFQNCKGLPSVVIPEGVESTGNNAFNGCSALQEVTIPSTVTSLGYLTFSNCTNLTTVNYNAANAGTSTSGNFDYVTFKGDTKLKNFIIGDKVQTIPYYLCYGCSGLTNLTITGDNLTNINEYAFYNCSLSEGITLPSSLVSIGNAAFQNCKGLPSVVIPEGVESTGNNAFNGCSALQEVTIPSTVTSLGYLTFSNCTNLTTVNYNAANAGTSTSGNFDYVTFKGDTKLKNFIIGDKVQTIPYYLCYGCSGLTNLTITGDNLTNINEYAFYNCSLSEGITLPSSLVSIGNAAFQNCKGLPSVVIPEGVKSTGNNAFNGCSALQEVTIPSTVTSLGYLTFSNCTNLTTVNYNAANAGTSTSGNFDYVTFKGDTKLKNFIIGDKVQTIPYYLCYGCSGLTNLTITGDNLTNINEYAFYNCKFSSVTLPRTVTSIGTYAFANNTTLTTVNCESLVAPTINNSYTFSGCSALTTINIPCGYSYPSYSSKWSSYTAKLHYDLPAYTVSVSSDNTNFGTAAKTVEPNCDTYMAELTATPKTGYHFVRWSDNVTMNPYEVYLDKDTALRAFFEINKYNFKLQVNEAARGTVSAINGVYEHGTKLDFEATANYGYHFAKWSDENKKNPRTLTIVQDSTITAIFDPNIYTITCGTSAYGVTEGAGKYDYLTEITLAATPNYGYKFKQWSDGVTINPRIVRVERDSVITAEYAPLDYQVVVKTADKKMGTVQPNSAEYPYLSQVELAAIPKYGYHFTEWSDGSNQNPHTITVTQDTVFTANFAINSYDVTILGSSYGTATGAGTFDYLTDIQIEAFPNYGYKFKSWSDGVKDNPRILTVESDTTLAMEFEPVKFTLRTQSNDDEKGTVTPSVGKYAYLSEVEITAEPVYGYHFAEWGDGRIANPRKVVIESDTLFTAIFEVNTYSIQATTSAMGRITGTGEYDYLSECTLRATANYGYRFVSWKDGVTTNPRKITVTQDSIFAAIYEPVNFTIEAYSDNTKQGTVTPETQEVPYNSIATITAIPVHGYKFLRWDDYNTDNPREITVTEDATFIASFERDSFNVVVAESEYGTVTGDWRYLYQTYATIEATPNYGYQFVQWSDGNTDNPRTLQVNDDIYLSMVFEPAFFNIRTQADNEAHGYTTPKDTSAIYLSNIVISAIPNYGYHFTEWSDGNTESERVITVTGNKTYMASFAPNTYSINVFANSQEYGSVSAPATGSYLDEITISATPYENYRFVSWSDGNTENPRVFTLTRDTAFMAVFEVANSGVCGDYWNLTWEYDKTEKILTISGNGTLNSNYEFGLEAPNRVEKLIIAEGVTSIGASAFKDFTTIKHVSIPSTVKNIYEQAFYNCSNIEEIYCYRNKPAVAYSNTFDGIDKFSCTLHVLQPSIEMYKVATGWREFYYIESINSIETPLADDEVVVEPAENTVTITWPISEGAETYTIEITKEGVVYCRLVFNYNGQLLGIAFAPSRNGAPHHTQAATMTATGMQFTVTGLESGTHYGYSVTIKSETDVVASFSGDFTTIGGDNMPTDIEDNRVSVTSQKLLRDGQIFILRGEKVYTVTGQEVK